jgi:Na+/H+-dicarboxylate symporter
MKVLIWIKNIIILFFSVIFLAIGINTLIGSFGLNNPVEFLMYFFSACLLIMVCIVGLIYIFFRVFPVKLKERIDDEAAKPRV